MSETLTELEAEILQKVKAAMPTGIPEYEFGEESESPATTKAISSLVSTRGLLKWEDRKKDGWFLVTA